MRRARVASLALAALAVAESAPAQQTPGAPPSAAAWKSAEAVSLARPASRCALLRSGDWIKVRCTLPAAAIEQLGGSPKGVSLSIDGKLTTANPYEATSQRAAEIVFPVAPGDARYFEIQAFRLRVVCSTDQCWAEGNAWSTAARVSEQWLAGDPAPTVSVVDVDLGDESWRMGPNGERLSPTERER